MAVTRSANPTRARIVRTAATLFREQGADATRLDDVCLASGVSPEQLRHYFDSKAALVRDVLGAVNVDAGAPLIRARLDTWAGIAAWLEAVVSWSERWGICPPGLIAAETAWEDASPMVVEVRSCTEWQAHLSSGLATLKFRGLLRADASPYALAEFTIAALQGGLVLARAHGDVEPLANAAVHTLEHLRSFAV